MRDERLEKMTRLFLEYLLNSKSAVVLTGAGISVPSGIPDFRSPNGLYAKYGKDIFDIEAFLKNPERFYSFSREGLISMLDAEPNQVHYLLAKLEDRGLIKGVITQNIDGLHTKAGSKNVVEIHGSVRTWSCLKCGKSYEMMNNENKTYLLEHDFRCSCGGLTKPDITFFGEMLPLQEFSKAQRWAEKSDVFITMGTSLAVYPAAQLPIYALRNNAKLFIINKGETELDKYAMIKIEAELSEFCNYLEKLIEGV